MTETSHLLSVSDDQGGQKSENDVMKRRKKKNV